MIVHLDSVAGVVLPGLADPGEALGFATRDEAQAAVASSLGMRAV